MELKHLLSLVTASMTALGAILYSMGSQHAELAVALWVAAILSLVVTDFLGVVRLSRNAGLFLMWAALAVFLPRFLLEATRSGRLLLGQSPDWQLQTVASILICLQGVLLFQEKDARTYGWLILMSLLQVVVAARYSLGVAFGSLLMIYGTIGMFALSLLTLYAQQRRDAREKAAARPRWRLFAMLRGEKRKVKRRESAAAVGRWPLARVEPGFSSAAAGAGRAGIVPEFFARLALIVVGTVLLAAMIFYTIPRPWIRSWRAGESNREVSIVGFNDEITLGSLGETIESREEVMRVRLLDAATHKPYPLHDEIYLRGSSATWYSQNQWRRRPPQENLNEHPDQHYGLPRHEPFDDLKNPLYHIGPPVIQQTVLEPYLDRIDLFYIWPLIEPEKAEVQGIRYDPLSQRLSRASSVFGEPRPGTFTFEVKTSGLVDGEQAPLVPASSTMNASRKSRLLQMPQGKNALPRVAALAERWRQEAGLKKSQQYDLARCFERQLSSSGQFQYSLEGRQRDPSIDAIEDFVSNHPQGHCEYFATALAMMLRSQGIPSRVVMGYRCDEWDPQGQFFQVRQLHAHAWVEAFLAREQVPESLRAKDPPMWQNGGWLRLDGTPAADLGTVAANRTAWGTWQAQLHGLEHYWENYIADMDRTKQQQSVYEPIRQGVRDFLNGLINPATWREFFAERWAALVRTFASGIMGKLIGAVLLLAIAGFLGLTGWWLARLVARSWRRLAGRGSLRSRRMRSSVEFYHRFEQLVARCGLMRSAGQTPREFARAAGARLATISGRPELSDRAVEVAEAFYSVRFGSRTMDAAAAQAIQKTLEELKDSADGSRPVNSARPRKR